jgi:hypothetical protein
MVWMLQPQIMLPCCIGMIGAGQEVMPPELDQPLTDEEDDHEEVLDAWLALLKETAEP